MKFVLPRASKERLDALLSYLGDRAYDFKKCFDVQSEYCLMYADLMLRGMESRDLEYGERHHIVPFCFYKMEKKNCVRSSKYVSYNNMTYLTYQEHSYAHYCAAQCGMGIMKGKMASAFLRMYNRAKYMPTNCEVISIISSEEFEATRKLIPKIAKVESEGRTHTWEDHAQAKKDYYYANKDKIDAYQKSYREDHKDELKVYDKEYYQANKEKKIESRRNYVETHKELILNRAKKYREAHLDECKKKCREYHASHKEEQQAKQKAYREEKRAAGYRYRKNPVTGKHEWMFVGINTEAA